MLSRQSAGSAPLLLNPFVCTRCLRAASTSRTRHRPAAAAAAAILSSTSAPPSSFTATTQPPRLRTFATSSSSPPSGLTPLPTRRLLALSGPDAPKFLQGLTTNNVAPAQRAGWYTAFLNAQGRVLHDAFVYPTALANGASGGGNNNNNNNATDGTDEWACFVEVDARGVEALWKVLRRHRLRSKVRMRVVDEGEWEVWGAWVPAEVEADAGVAATLEGLAAAGGGGGRGGGGGGGERAVVHLRDDRAPGFGHRLLVPGGKKGEAVLPPLFAGLERVTPADYRVRRYLWGVPEGLEEIRPEEALPLESNIDLMRGVDFKKGCYVGQELTIRTKHTGVVRKRILPVRLYDLEGPEPESLAFVEGGSPVRAEDVPEVAADVKKVADGGDAEAENGTGRRRRSAGRSAGKWLTGVGNVGLALCRLEMMTDVKVAAEGMGAGGSYKPGMRFGLRWTVEGQEGEKSVGIKAFVPEWHRLRAEEDVKDKKKKRPVSREEDEEDI